MVFKLNFCMLLFVLNVNFARCQDPTTATNLDAQTAGAETTDVPMDVSTDVPTDVSTDVSTDVPSVTTEGVVTEDDKDDDELKTGIDDIDFDIKDNTTNSSTGFDSYDFDPRFVVLKPIPFLNGSRPVPEIGSEFVLICSVRDSGGLTSEVIISRGLGREMIVSFDQYSDECEILDTPPTKYEAFCGRGTGEKDSMIKTYTLKIKKVSELDLTWWWCTITDDSLRSQAINLGEARYAKAVDNGCSEPHCLFSLYSTIVFLSWAMK